MVDTVTSSTRPKHPYFATLLVLVAVIILCGLGLWQMQRAEQKQSRLEQIEQRSSTARLSLRELLEFEEKRDLPFEVFGAPDPEKVFYLDNRIESGHVGYHVLVPVETDYGVQLINFGWIKAEQLRTQLPEVKIDATAQQYIGVSAVPNINPMVTETATKQDGWPLVIQQIDLPLMSTFLGIQLSPVVMQLSPEHPAGLVRNWKPVVMSPQKHYGYAIQWFGLAIACLVIYIVALLKRNR
ncbi:SURF1 family protein [Aliiglaciecola sp. M165]|uniref:SURF1 family protein n=1 Tax=Aliiglaciecola sp. M165 TaxID=2593649 RepID=UPI00117F7336|nr:SURF1 family protein [Aliiglaciecola sp. M165]TRY33351.1 SURF1 family protein [Aliiglaciecola sp. M165]